MASAPLEGVRVHAVWAPRPASQGTRVKSLPQVTLMQLKVGRISGDDFPRGMDVSRSRYSEELSHASLSLGTEQHSSQRQVCHEEALEMEKRLFCPACQPSKLWFGLLSCANSESQDCKPNCGCAFSPGDIDQMPRTPCSAPARAGASSPAPRT